MTELLERQLLVLSQHLDVDVGDRLVADVMRRIDTRQIDVEPPLAEQSITRVRTRRRLAAAGLALAAGIVSVLAIPGSRHAVADWFGIGSTRIERPPITEVSTAIAASADTANTPASATVTTAETPAAAVADSATGSTRGPVSTTAPATFPTDLDLGLDLGEPISKLEAHELTGLPVPVSDLLGTPSGVYVVIPPRAGQIVVVYPASAALPPSPVAGVGALLSAVSGRLDDGLFAKFAAEGTTVENLSVTVASGAMVPAVWLAGEPHGYAMVDADGEVLFDSLRLATNTLLWMQDGVVFRLEAQLTREQAVDIASSVVAAR